MDNLMDDEQLEKLSRDDHVTSLNLSGSVVTDRGLEVLQHLRELRVFEMCWQSGITDKGVSHLRHCEQLEEVDLLGTNTGDGAITALTGKPKLRKFKTGRNVT
ncbi:MAG TPA: hypothetical protein VFX63_02295, partial [Pyrinomonadaceae bacterium]|nr:hypothetical protein [Pyrinomonadaceae bacterium]